MLKIVYLFSEMGGAHSDARERIAHDVINFIPFVNLAYNLVRTAVYAGKGNETEVARSVAALVGSAISSIPLAGTGAAAASAGAMAATRAGATAGTIASGAVNSFQPVAGGVINYALNKKI